MLLLVLILVLAAFALLVVALVQGSVLWAWLSVVISVGAASALLFDWWQRQQALRAEETPPPAPRGQRRLSPPGSGDIESVTEFIPVLPHPGYGQPPAAGAETRFIPGGQVQPPVDEAERTVFLPVARPPGSAGQPSGATPPGPPWSGSPSLSVTGSDPATTAPDASDGPDDRTEFAVPPGGETIFQPTADAAARTNGVARPDEATAVPETAVSLFGAGVAGRPDVMPPAGEHPHAPADVPGGDVTAMAPVRPHDEPPPGPPAVALPPAGPDGEPPEETADAGAAAIVNELQDDVVVVDERPRYHVESCPFLPGRPLIPLPVREAAELGFSPCGWCTPNRILADRHRTAAH